MREQDIDPARVDVVHNPIDAEDAWSPSLPEPVTLVRLSSDRSWGGMNAGAAELQRRGARWMLLLTHDARLEPGAVGVLQSVGERHASAGVVGPLLYLENGTLWSAGVHSDGGIARHGEEWEEGADAIDRNSVDGTILMVRTSAFRDAEGFDERFFMSWEEADFCLRCTRAGWRVVVAPGARALTAPGRSRRPAVHAYLQTRNGLEYARRHQGRTAGGPTSGRGRAEAMHLGSSPPVFGEVASADGMALHRRSLDGCRDGHVRLPQGPLGSATGGGATAQRRRPETRRVDRPDPRWSAEEAAVCAQASAVQEQLRGELVGEEVELVGDVVVADERADAVDVGGVVAAAVTQPGREAAPTPGCSAVCHATERS